MKRENCLLYSVFQETLVLLMSLDKTILFFKLIDFCKGRLFSGV